jgi:hypothetical protein
MLKERERQKEAEVEALKRSMQSGMVWKNYFLTFLVVLLIHDVRYSSYNSACIFFFYLTA